ncbi:BTAD domain-containing putative transcriptional regulator [Streptomyces sp. S1D4-11]
MRRSGGYLLEARLDQVDVYRFRQLIDQARAVERTDPARAARLLGDALGLWRGDPLSGLQGQWAARMREAWRRQRQDAAVGWARAELRLGDPASVIGPLTGLLGEYPLAEPLAEALMRALHDTGRSAEALDCYAAVRERLAEELGTDPGPALGQLHQAILRGHQSESASRPKPRCSRRPRWRDRANIPPNCPWPYAGSPAVTRNWPASRRSSPRRRETPRRW